MKSNIVAGNSEMRKGKNRSKSLLMLTLTAALLTAACGGGGLTEEQLIELEETKTAALAAEEKIQERKVTRKSLSENLAAKKSDLKQLHSDKEILIQRLKDLEKLNKVETEADTSAVDSDTTGNGDGR